MPFYKDRVFQWIFIILLLFKTAAFCHIYYANPLGEAVLIFPDSLTYVYPAQTFLQYADMWEAVTVNPMLLRTPGYPFFLSVIQFITGNLTWSVAAVQNLLSLLLLIPVYLTARQLSGLRAARWAAVFCAISVLYFSLSFAVLTEILCTFLLAWFVYLIIRFLNAPHIHSLLGAALLLAAAVYVRPAAYYFMFASAIILVCFSIGKLVSCPVRKIGMAFILPLCLFIGAWHIRNFRQTGFSGFSSVNAYNLYMWNEDYLADKFNIPVTQAHQALEKALPPGFNALPAKEQVRIYQSMALPLVKESFRYKLTHAPLWAAKTLFGANFIHISRLVSGGHATGALLDGEMLNHTQAVHHNWLENRSAKLLFGATAGQVLLTVFFGTVGFIFLWKKKKAETFFLAIYCLYFWGIGSTFFGAYARFRAPFEFVLCITAGAAAAMLSDSIKHIKRPAKKI